MLIILQILYICIILATWLLISYKFIVIQKWSYYLQILLKYIFIANMKEDSLLSSLSNLSYHANNNSIDFFNDSASMGGFNEIKVRPPP